MIRISRPCAIMQNHWYTRQVCFPGKPHVLGLTHIICLPCQGDFVLLVLLGGVLRNLSVTCPSLPAWGPCECTMWMQSLMHRQCHCSVASGMVTSTCSSLLKAYHVGDKTQGWLTCRNSFGNGRSLLSRSTHSALIVTPCLPMISGKLEGCIITPSSLKSSAKGRSDRIAHIQRGAKFGCSCNTNRTFRNENRPSSQVVFWERTGLRNQGKTEETWNCEMDQWYRIIPKDAKWCLMFPLIKQCIKQLRIHGMDGMETSSQLVLESHSTVTLLYQLLCHRHDYHKIPWNTLEYHEKCKRACANMNLVLIATVNVAKRVYVVNLVHICVIYVSYVAKICWKSQWMTWTWMQNAQGPNNHWIIQCVPCVQCVLDRHVSHFHCLRKCFVKVIYVKNLKKGVIFLIWNILKRFCYLEVRKMCHLWTLPPSDACLLRAHNCKNLTVGVDVLHSRLLLRRHQAKSN